MKSALRHTIPASLALAICAAAPLYGHADTTVPKPPSNQKVVHKQLSEGEFRFASALSVLAQKCLSCHRPGGSASDFTAYLTSESLWVAAQLVVPGQSQNSLLYKYLQGSGFSPAPLGSMPLGSTLSAAQLFAIRDWIDRMQDPEILPTPTPTPTPSGMTYGLEPSQSGPRLGAREYVKSVLDEVFGPQAVAVTNPEVLYRISIYGTVCDQMGQAPVTGQGEDTCIGVDSNLFSGPIVSVDSPSRAGRNMEACAALVFNTNEQIVRYAITQATQISDLSYLVNDPIPNAAQIIAAYRLFHPGELAPPQAVLNKLTLLAQAVQQANKPLDPWRYVLLTICYDPTWQVQ